MSEPTVRERIKRVQRDFTDGKPAPAQARNYLIELTALSGNVADEVRAAEAQYREVLLTAMETEKKANRAKIVAESTPAYARYREAKDIADLVKQLIISTRGYLRSLDTEVNLAR